jgi:glycerol-3-phosphate dehydrogenase (NAD(P)+)
MSVCSQELVENMPTLVVVASEDEKVASEVTALFAHARLRVYKSNDIIGVEVGGALKNVFAIGTSFSFTLFR